MAVIAVGRYEFPSSRRDDSTLAIATANSIPHARAKRVPLCLKVLRYYFIKS